MKKDSNELQFTPILIPIFICIMCFVTICFCGLTFWEKGKINKIKIDTISPQDSIIYNIEEINIENDYVSIKGWALKLDENIDRFYTHIVLVNEDINEYIQLPTAMENRVDVNEAYPGEYDYSAAGFYSKVKKGKLSNGTYKIGIYYQNNENNIFIVTDNIVSI